MEFFAANDPEGDPLWTDPDIHSAYLEALGRSVPPEDPFAEDDLRLDLDPIAAQAQFDAMLDIERTVRDARALVAEQDLGFHRILVRADAEPDAWVGPDPTLDPTWVDPRGRTIAAIRAYRRNLAVRSAAADIGARVHLTDNQVRNRAHRAMVLRTRAPRLWTACMMGAVSEQNMAIATDLASSLPAEEPDSWEAFDESIHDAAATLAPGRFRQRARAARERAHSEPLAVRHACAAEDRRVDIDDTVDGMAFVTALVPVAGAHGLDRHLDEAADDLAAHPDETRTHAQLRADVFIDMLTRAPDGPGSRVGATVSITIPALSLLGRSDEPATLEGYGPIDMKTAKQLAAGSTSWLRILTDPFTGTILDVERRTYRVPADLRRWLGVTYPTCIFPGCTRPARKCDMDHRKRWTDGGTTSSENLGPACPPHHPVKDETLWRLRREPGTGRLIWTSPTGHDIAVDPPPF